MAPSSPKLRKSYLVFLFVWHYIHHKRERVLCPDGPEGQGRLDDVGTIVVLRWGDPVFASHSAIGIMATGEK